MQIIWRDSADAAVYEEARIGRVFNHRRPQRYPLAVVQATCVDDIVNAVKLAAVKGCRVAVRSGGHSWAAWSVRDESILIDLGSYKHLDIDPTSRIASASPSMTGSAINRILTNEHGLMFPGGHCPDVGIGGFLLQGGMGWNCRGWGWACEKVTAVDVVTADGELLHCNEQENKDLYWAARGAGPGISDTMPSTSFRFEHYSADNRCSLRTGFPAIVTKFHLSLIPYPEKGFRSSGYIYPLEKYDEAFNWILSITPDFDMDTEIVAVGLYPEGRDEICLFILLVTMKSTAEDAERALAPAQHSRPNGTLEEWFCQEDSIENSADVAQVLKEAYTTLPHRKAFTLWYAMNPCSRRSLPDMALSMQSDHYFALYTIWEDEADDARCQSWVQNIMKRVERQSVGAYLGDSDFQERRTCYWSEDNGRRLMNIRRKWDPAGRICGYLDEGDASGTAGLANVREWKS